VSAFRTPHADYASVWCDAEPVLVLIGDLLLRRDERDRFEIASGFAKPVAPARPATFWHSPDYQQVRCHKDCYTLGLIQAEVVRALHAAALTGAPWQNGKAILSAAGSRSLKMSDVFKSQTRWRALILSNGRGSYRLNCD
jgi:hypothetical protein